MLLVQEKYVCNIYIMIYILIPYFGAFQNYFQFYLDSLGINSDILNVIVFTDIDLDTYKLPPNLIVYKITLDEVRERLSSFLKKEYNKSLEPANLLLKPYKLVDIKIIYGVLFEDFVNKHAKENDYIGWGDCDLIYGKLSKFIDLSNDYDAIGGYNGHFTVFKNSMDNKYLFRRVQNYCDIIISEKIFVADEIAFRPVFNDYRKTHKVYDLHLTITDIVPPCFFHLFRDDHEKREKNFFDVYNSSKNISYLYFNRMQETLNVCYDDGSKKETSYAHLQKRVMEMPFTKYNNGFYINENSFSLELPRQNYLQHQTCRFSESKDVTKIRLHLPAVPNTITRDEFSHCAFTTKVKQFPKMMQSMGFEVYHYGVETSQTEALKNIELLSLQEWEELRIKSIMYLDKSLTRTDAIKTISDKTQFIGKLANIQTPLFEKFNKRFRKKLQENYRSNATDIVCLPVGCAHKQALEGLNYVVVEIGIGHPNSFEKYRVFESYAWLNHTLGSEKIDPPNYWFVVPYSFDVDAFKAVSRYPQKPKIGFLGRITSDKGLFVITEVAKRFPDVEFVICGQGDPQPFLKHPNIKYKLPIHGTERSDFLGSLTAFISPTVYLEPFGCGLVEAQLCGTPVITCDHGGMVETVENWKTGLRCHTLADYCYGIEMAINEEFDRNYIRERAVSQYNMNNAATKYKYIFNSVLDIHNGKGGWYSSDSYIDSTRSFAPLEITTLPKTYNSVIPLNIFQTWKSLTLPPKMLQTVEKLKEDNPEFTYHLYDDAMCAKFIEENFGQDTHDAFINLIPGAYKSDLWRLCILYKYGGIYLDIKYKLLNDFRLKYLTDKEYYVSDGEFSLGGNKYFSIYNGLMVSKPKNNFLLKTINAIVENSKHCNYGHNPWAVTGPNLVGQLFPYPDYNFELVHMGPRSDEKIVYNGRRICEFYSEYRKEQSEIDKNNYYVDLWNQKKVFKNEKITKS